MVGSAVRCGSPTPPTPPPPSPPLLQRWQQLGGIKGSMVRRAHERFKRVPLFTLSSEGVSVQLNNTGKLIAGRVDW